MNACQCNVPRSDVNAPVCSGSGADGEADGSGGLQRPGAAEAPPGGNSGNCSVRPSTGHTDAAGAAGKHTNTRIIYYSLLL